MAGVSGATTSVKVMCECDGVHDAVAGPAAGAAFSRREVLSALAGPAVLAPASSLVLPDRAAATAAPAATVVPPVELRPGLLVYPRAAWAAGLPARRAIPDEDDARFLLVHHTATPIYPQSIRRTLRGIYSFHTRTKGWPDICYQFMVAHNGTVWEARSGSIERAVQADATGGNQGFAQLVCMIGNYQVSRPTRASITSLVRVLAWLAERDGIDTAPGATATFVSRGSNRWPAGRTVTTSTINGHRSMSATACPGRHLLARLPEIRRAVDAQRRAWSTPTA